MLLENPEIRKKNDKIVKHNNGKHHSKDTIEHIKNKLINSQLLQKPIDKKYTEERYILLIFHTGDAGYGIEVLLTAKNVWEAVLQAKLIRELHEFNKYDLEIKI